MKSKNTSLFLRLSIGIVFLWFGIDKFLNPAMWAAWMPPWMSSLWPWSINSFMYFQGGIEAILGILLLIGFYTKWASRLSALILLSIVIVLGINDITALGRIGDVTIRDIAILLAAIALCYQEKFPWSLDNKFKKNP